MLAAAALLGLSTDHLILTDADVTAERLAQYEWFTGNIGTTISAEYLTPAAVPRPWTSAWLNNGRRDRAVAVAGDLDAATLRTRTATRQTWDVIAGPDGATLLLPTLYWPGWRAVVDGQPAALSAQPGSGLMTLVVPAGDHVLTLELHRTPVQSRGRVAVAHGRARRRGVVARWSSCPLALGERVRERVFCPLALGERVRERVFRPLALGERVRERVFRPLALRERVRERVFRPLALGERVRERVCRALPGRVVRI